MQARPLSSDIQEFGVLTLSLWWKATPQAALPCEPQVDPAESKNQGMYRNFTRENRESPQPPAQMIAGRAAQGRLRPQA